MTGGPDRLPFYARLLRLQHIRPGVLSCFLFLEGTLVVSGLLALAGVVTAWAVLVLPVAVAAAVKINDLVAGAMAGPKPAGQPSPPAAEPSRSRSERPPAERHRSSRPRSEGSRSGRANSEGSRGAERSHGEARSGRYGSGRYGSGRYGSGRNRSAPAQPDRSPATRSEEPGSTRSLRSDTPTSFDLLWEKLEADSEDGDR